MEITVYFRTYRAFGSHVTLFLIGPYLCMGMPLLGETIKEIELVFYFSSVGPGSKTHGIPYDTFRSKLKQRPSLTFRRKYGKAEILFASDLLTSRSVKKSHHLSLDLFCHGCREVVDNIKLLRTRMTKDERFDFNAFQTWLDQRIEQLPKTFDELLSIQAEIDLHLMSVRAGRTEWNQIDTDFFQFHPDAPSLLNDPRLWDITNELSPHGNDTGADVLELYRQWRKHNRAMSAEVFLSDLLLTWKVTMPPDPTNAYSVQTYRQAVIGLAFAQLKLHASCEPQIAAFALTALADQPQSSLNTKMKSILKNYVRTTNE